MHGAIIQECDVWTPVAAHALQMNRPGALPVSLLVYSSTTTCYKGRQTCAWHHALNMKD